MNTFETASTIKDLLNSDASFDAGLCNRDARLVGDCVNFSFPAPVIGGACCGVIRVYEDGRVFDDTSDETFPSYAAWLDGFKDLLRG